MRYRRAIVFGAVIAIIITLALAVIRPPVLLHFKDPSAVDPGDGLFVVFNPLRNKEPEQSAAAFIDYLKDGKCAEAIAHLPKDEYHEQICEEESKHRITSWEMIDRKDEPNKTILHIKAYRADYPNNVYGNAYVTVKKNLAAWQVSNFEAWY